MTKTAVKLDDKYLQTEGQIYLSSLQALVRLPILQRRRDVAAGLNTAGFITGYRGSPIGTYDAALWAAQEHLDANHIRFLPGVNEELAASTLKGTQWTDYYPEKKYDGVFGLWYGKHLGVERACEALKQGNNSGGSKHGGVLVVAGDDMGGKSSITAAESDHVFITAMMPLLYPSTTQEFIDFGLYGWALARFTGLWVGFKTVTDTVELTSTVSADSSSLEIFTPEGVAMPPEGVHTFKTDFFPLVQERRLVDFKLPAAEAFVAANGIDRITLDSPKRRLGIVSAGKAYLDVREALSELSIDEELARDLGIRLYKLGMVWPLEPSGAEGFCKGHDEILVVEEKRPVIEEQLTYQLYSWSSDHRPRIVGKRDETGRQLIPAHGETSVPMLIDVIARRLRNLGISNPRIDASLERLEAERQQVAELPAVKAIRTPYFCSGCPHNSSTRTVDGSLTFTGVGCYGIVPLVMPQRNHEYAVQMGGEGTLWVGLHQFLDLEHAFQNLGDGTYFHSGVLAVRAAVASGANITYKMLYNDAVAMTGGQPVDGEMTVEMMANQLYWEGVKPIAVVTDEPDKYPSNVVWPPETTVHHRDELEQVQRRMQKQKGVSAIVYDQTCAAEKRRRRKRGLFPDPPKRVFINQDVCEGCGDCSDKSNCMSVQPVETEFGRKRRIDQSSCNKDYTCLKGFCPSFVTVHGGELRKAEPSHGADDLAELFSRLPEPEPVAFDGAYNILLTGIGGTGVLTVGAIIGMAAHIDEKACSIMDITGMAQKGGAVLSHIRLGAEQHDISAPRLWERSADLVLGCDLVVTAGPAATQLVRPQTGRIVVNSDVVPTAQFQTNQNIDFSKHSMLSVLNRLVGENNVSPVAATNYATKLMGDSIATNVFMLGYALQKGLVPLSVTAVEKAIELNGVAVKANLHTLSWGRMAAGDPSAVEKFVAKAGADTVQELPLSETLDQLIERRIEHLTGYQSKRYANTYRRFVERVREKESSIVGSNEMTEAVARYLSKLMAYKDEYEVARLYTSGQFKRRLREQFDGDYKLKFHLAPPVLSPTDKRTGKPGKIAFGSWVFPLFRVLARLKKVRGTALDVFGYSGERREERELIADYRVTVETLLDRLTAENHERAVAIARLPEMVKGYGHIKADNIEAYRAERDSLLAGLDAAEAKAA